MREILFKGFHPDKNGKAEITLNGEKIKGEWKHGGYCETRTWDLIKGKIAYIIGNSTGDIKPQELSFNEVIPETICEFTGFKDKFGKNIFEGDIVKVVTPRHRAIGIVKVGIGEIDGDGYKFIGVYGEIDGKRGEMVARSDKNYEVLGNVYDNPELLESRSEKGINGTPLTIEELKSLKIGEWIWIQDKNNGSAYYRLCKSNLMTLNDGIAVCDKRNGGVAVGIELPYSAYGTNWVAYRNKEEAETADYGNIKQAQIEILQNLKDKLADFAGGNNEEEVLSKIESCMDVENCIDELIKELQNKGAQNQ